MNEFQVPRKPRKHTEAPVVIGPSAPYEEYKPDLATRISMERARRDQPPTIALGSSVPAYVGGEGRLL
jgi:hypothetical protein